MSHRPTIDTNCRICNHQMHLYRERPASQVICKSCYDSLAAASAHLQNLVTRHDLLTAKLATEGNDLRIASDVAYAALMDAIQSVTTEIIGVTLDIKHWHQGVKLPHYLELVPLSTIIDEITRLMYEDLGCLNDDPHWVAEEDLADIFDRMETHQAEAEERLNDYRYEQEDL